MLRHSRGLVGNLYFLWLLFSLVANFTWAQSETATVSGQVVDPSGLNVTGAQVKLVDIDRDTSTSATTNNSGLYTFPSVRPGRYRIAVTAAGFKVVNVTGVTVNVQDHLEQNFKLVVGSISESITVEGGAPLVETESAAVSTVVDRQFAENLPMNGRSFQTLIQLTPGVVLTTSTALDSGQFSVNGQRAASNYWMVDGVSANIGIGTGGNPGNGFAGSVGSFGALGGTNSLVSVDALEEFRVLTSTYAPEFGRTPGGQISIVTRSGTNLLHGSAFDYFRNDVLDANNWFNGYTNDPALPKAEERQNDFGGTLGGPVAKDRAFFFLSYEGIRLRLPQTLLSSVPDLNARSLALPSLQPYLKAFPVPNGTDNESEGVADFNASYSNRSTLDAYSLRLDDKLRENVALFGRYDYSPSEIDLRGSGGGSLNTVSPSRITTQTATFGLTWLLSSSMSDDLRLNYSRTRSQSYFVLDSFGGAVPLTALPLPNSYNVRNASFSLDIFSLANGFLTEGQGADNLQRQINVVDSLTLQRGSHSLKFGIDFRRLTPFYGPSLYSQSPLFLDVPSAEIGSLEYSFNTSNRSATILLRNLGAFAQDSWKIIPRLTLTYGIRWDVDFSPASLDGPSLVAVRGYDPSDLSNLTVAAQGTPPFNTAYGNVAPRLGIAYQVSTGPNWLTVLRGGFGIFFDLATSEVGNTFNASYPFEGFNLIPGPPLGGTATFPLTSAEASPPAIALSAQSQIAAFNPNLRLPYTMQWNVSIEQALGTREALSASYIGSAGRRLIQSAYVYAPNPSLGSADLIDNTAASDYNALQIQFHRPLSHGLQTLASYTWSHSIDDGSAGSYGNAANTGVPTLNPSANRGPSDFDIRNAFSAAVTYDIPFRKSSGLGVRVLGGWSLDNVIQARSGSPVNVYDGLFYKLLNGSTQIRPDVVPNIPLYLYGSQYPGGKALNNTPNQGGAGCIGPFCPPPTNGSGIPLRQGDLGRNALRGFSAKQWDLAIHRDIPIRESLKAQFRAEMFNVLNHPNFGPPVSDFSQPNFGLSTVMLAQSLGGGNLGGGGFSPLYQVGGPRSIQLALKIIF